MNSNHTTSLTNAQHEILNFFSVNLNEDELQDFKKNIAQFLLQRIRKEADIIWSQKSYNKETIKKWLNPNP